MVLAVLVAIGLLHRVLAILSAIGLLHRVLSAIGLLHGFGRSDCNRVTP